MIRRIYHSNTFLCSSFHAWSRLVELPSSDEMKMYYTEHDFQVDLEIYEFSLKFHAERIQQ